MKTTAAILSLACLLGVVSCTTFENNLDTSLALSGTLTVNRSEITVPATSSTETIVVSCGELWDIASKPEWIIVDDISAIHNGEGANDKWFMAPQWEATIHILSNTGPGRSGQLVLESASGKATITIIQAGEDGGEPVVPNEKATGDGTLYSPYNPAAAYALASSLATDAESADVYVKGKISFIEFEFNQEHGTAKFHISEDGTTSGIQFLCYGLLYDSFHYWVEGNSQIAIGDEVIIYGKLTNYRGTTPESVNRNACLYSLNGKTDGKGKPISVTSLSISSNNISLNVGETAQLIVAVSPSNASNKTVIWSTDNEDIVTVNSNGTVTAVSEGSANIITTTENGALSAACLVTVTPRPSGNGTLSSPYNPEEANALASSLSPDGKSAEVFVKGKISSIKYVFDEEYGTATFSISEDGTSSGSQFTCYGLLYYSFHFWAKGDSQIAIGDEVIIYGKLTNFKGNTPESMNREACLYSLKGKTDGRGTPVSVNSITLSESILSLSVSSTVQLKATVLPTNASNKAVKWTSDKPSIASVDKEGTVSANAEGIAIITATTENGALTATCEVTVELLGPNAVDLGLSVKWASCNVGANRPEEYGDYFAWGETSPKSYYDWSTYTLCNGSYKSMTKYNTNSSYGTVDNKTTFKDYYYVDDAARSNWHGSWRTPTDEEWTELRNNCSCIWKSNYNGTGINGYLVTGPNNNSIFLPAAGYRNEAALYDANSWGYYWSSSLCTNIPNNAWRVHFYDSQVYFDGGTRRYGLSVRPVTD